MKYLIVVLALLSTAPLAEEKTCDKLKQDGLTQEQLAQRGCCSWHGGVCGCTGGRAVCCDGKLSPTCGCHGEDTLKKLIDNNFEYNQKG